MIEKFKVKCRYCKKEVERQMKKRVASCFECKAKKMREYNLKHK